MTAAMPATVPRHGGGRPQAKPGESAGGKPLAAAAAVAPPLLDDHSSLKQPVADVQAMPNSTGSAASIPQLLARLATGHSAATCVPHLEALQAHAADCSPSPSAFAAHLHTLITAAPPAQLPSDALEVHLRAVAVMAKDCAAHKQALCEAGLVDAIAGCLLAQQQPGAQPPEPQQEEPQPRYQLALPPAAAAAACNALANLCIRNTAACMRLVALEAVPAAMGLLHVAHPKLALASLTLVMTLSHCQQAVPALAAAGMFSSLAQVAAAAGSSSGVAATYLANLSSHAVFAPHLLQPPVLSTLVQALRAGGAAGAGDGLALQQLAVTVNNLAHHSSTGGQEKLVQAGAVPVLVRLVSGGGLAGGGAAVSSTVAEAAVDALANLCLRNAAAQLQAAEAEGLPALLRLLQQADQQQQPELAAKAARALSNAMMGNDVNQQLAASAGAAQLLVRQLSHPGSPPGLVKQLLAALANFVMRCPANQQEVLAVPRAAECIVRHLEPPPAGPGSSHSPAEVEVMERAAILVANLTWMHAPAQQQFAAAGAVRPLVAMLSAPRAQVAMCGAGALSNLALNNRELQDAIAAAGAVPLLVALLRASSSSLVDKTLHALGSLAFNNTELQLQLLQAQAAPQLVALLRVKQPTIVAEAARVIGNMCHGHEAVAVALAGYGALEQLARLLSLQAVGVVKNALVALCNLVLTVPAHQEQLLQAPGVAAALLRLLKVRSEDVAQRAAFCVYSVAQGNGRCQALLVQAQFVPALVQLLGHRAPAVAEKAVLAIGALATGNHACQVALASSGAIPGLTRLLASRSAGLLKRTVDALAAIGGPAPLVKLVGNKRAFVAEYAAAALAHIVLSEQGGSEGGSEQQARQRLVKAGAVPALLSACACSTHRSTGVNEQAAAALVRLCQDSGAAQELSNASCRALLRTLASGPNATVALLAGNIMQQLGA